MCFRTHYILKLENDKQIETFFNIPVWLKIGHALEYNGFFPFSKVISQTIKFLTGGPTLFNKIRKKL